MNDILKMCRYYIISGSSNMGKYFVIFFVISILSGLVGLPIGCLSFALFAGLAAAPEIYGDKDSQRIFAILPVSRGTVIRGEFAATIGTILIGQVFSVLFLALCDWRPLYNMLPDKIKQQLALAITDLELRNVAVIIIFAAFICVFFSLLSMIMHIHGNDYCLTFLSILFGIFMIAVIICIILDEKEILDINKIIQNLGMSDRQYILAIIISNAVSLGAGFLCCERTISRTADKEF